MNTKLFILISFLFLLTSCKSQNFKDGDIIFQTSKSSQSVMLSKVTKSKLTHCGIIFHRNGKPYVIEASGVVKITPLNEWINRGVNKKYAVTRLNYVLPNNHKSIMYGYAKKQIGKSYDSKFQWSDNKIYCSELVWKIYNSSGYTLTYPKKFKDFDLSSNLVKLEIQKRYGTSLNLNELVVAPVDLYESDLMSIVYSNY